MLDNTARMLGTIGIWLSFAIVMAFGLCRMNWNGDSAEITFLLATVVVSGAAVISTAFVWLSRPATVAVHPVREQPAV
jgi:hypothetical protein